MITTLTYTKNNEQLTLTLECDSLEQLLAKELKGHASFRKDLELHLAQSYGDYDDLLTLAMSAPKEFGLQMTIQYEGKSELDPDDLEFD